MWVFRWQNVVKTHLQQPSISCDKTGTQSVQQSRLQDCRPLLQSRQTTTAFVIVSCLSTLAVDSSVSWGYLRQFCQHSQHSIHWQTLLLVGSHAASPPFGTVFPHLYALLIVSLVLGGLGSRLTCSRDICSRSAPLITLPGLLRVINSLLTY